MHRLRTGRNTSLEGGESVDLGKEAHHLVKSCAQACTAKGTRYIDQINVLHQISPVSILTHGLPARSRPRTGQKRGTTRAT